MLVIGLLLINKLCTSCFVLQFSIPSISNVILTSLISNLHNISHFVIKNNLFFSKKIFCSCSRWGVMVAATRVLHHSRVISSPTHRTATEQPRNTDGTHIETTEASQPSPTPNHLSWRKPPPPPHRPSPSNRPLELQNPT